MFGIDYTTGLVQIFWIKVSVLDILFYLGVLIGMYKNYRAYIKNFEVAAATLKLKEDETKLYLSKARREYILSTAKDKFHKVEDLAKETPWTGDDKLVEYTKFFVKGLCSAFNDPPTEEELELIRDRAAALAREDHIRKGEINKIIISHEEGD